MRIFAFIFILAALFAVTSGASIDSDELEIPMDRETRQWGNRPWGGGGWGREGGGWGNGGGWGRPGWGHGGGWGHGHGGWGHGGWSG
jgi:hypothetical protein